MLGLTPGRINLERGERSCVNNNNFFCSHSEYALLHLQGSEPGKRENKVILMDLLEF